jgi:hypothetical protein
VGSCAVRNRERCQTQHHRSQQDCPIRTIHPKLPNVSGVQRRAPEGSARSAEATAARAATRGSAARSPDQCLGEFRLEAQHRFLSQALKGDYIGLEPVDDGLWNIVYSNTLLGRLSERTGKISGASFRSDEC